VKERAAKRYIYHRGKEAESMKKNYEIKNTGAQAVKAPKKVSAPSGVKGVRGKDCRQGNNK